MVRKPSGERGLLGPQRSGVSVRILGGRDGSGSEESDSDDTGVHAECLILIRTLI